MNRTWLRENKYKWLRENKYNRMQELWRYSKKFRIRKKNYTRLNKCYYKIYK